VRVLVTGAGGWIGSRVLPALAAAGCEPVGLRGDLLDAAGLAETVGSLRPRAVVHLAGSTRGDEGPAALYRVHVEGSANLLRAIEQHAPGAHLVSLGSAAEYGPGSPGQPLDEGHACRPAGHYGLSKRLQTELLLSAAEWSGLRVTVLRVFNTIGAGMPRGFLLPDLFDRLRRLRAAGGGELEVADLDAVRDLVPVEKVVGTVVRVVRGRAPRGVFNVATGVGTRVGQVVEWLREASDFPWEIRPAGEGGGPRGGVRWSVGSPAALERELGPVEAPAARDAVVAAYRADVLEVEEAS